MPKHSFIQMEKIHNVKGRINYITSAERQENLYVFMNTTTPAFWKDLAKENQQEFKKSGTGGKCIEARELIIALPKDFVKYDSALLLQLFTQSFQNKYGVECVSALHHNKKKTNYHIHLIFSERKLLDSPVEKIASRNMFFDELGKRVRTKKEILDIAGKLRKGCKIIPKGEVYDRRIFTNKESYFKSEKFLEEEKKRYTELINQFIKNPQERLQVFERNGVYLPTKKIGKNNPKAAEIKADNEARVEWNQTVDLALIEGIPEADILQVKKEEITHQVRRSIAVHGRKPGLFRTIIDKAKVILSILIRKFQQPPKPQLNVDITEFYKLASIKVELEKQKLAIDRVEMQELPELKRRLGELKGVFKGRERKEMEQKIVNLNIGLSGMKSYLTNIVSRYGYESVKDFMRVYTKAESIVRQYQEDLEEWEEKRDSIPQEKESIRSQLKQFECETKEFSSRAVYQPECRGRTR